MNRILSSFVAVATVLSAAPAMAATPFVGKTRALNIDITGGSISFAVDGPGDRIKGTTSNASGHFTIGNADDLATTKGSVKVATNTLKTGNDTRDEHLQKDEWLNGAAAPAIQFTVDSLSGITVEGNKAHATATGTFSVRGASKPVSLPVTITVNKEVTKVKLEAKFKISRKDYGIRGKNVPGMTVGDVIDVEASVTGSVK